MEAVNTRDQGVSEKDTKHGALELKVLPRKPQDMRYQLWNDSSWE